MRVPPAPPSARLQRLVERFVAGGVDSLWWADHLMSFASPELWEDAEGAPSEQALHTYVDPFVAMTWCASFIGSTTVGTCVTDAVRRMPASLAQTALSVDHAVAGQVVLGLGAGEVANYRPYGWDVPSPAGRFEDATRQIRAYLDGPGPDKDGAIVALRPPEGSAGPQLWLAAHGPRGFRLVGECADGWLPTGLDAETWGAGRDAISDAAIAYGRSPGDITMAASLDVVVQDTRQEAVDLLQHPAVRHVCLLSPPATFRRYGVEHPLGASAISSLIATTDGHRLLAAARAIPDRMVEEQVIHGTVDDVVAQIKRYEGLQHVRLSDLSGAVSPGGGADRLLAVMEGLRP